MANPTSASIRALKPGEDSRLNWKTINQCVAQLKTQQARASDLRGGVVELRHKPRDVWGGGGAEIEMALCDPTTGEVTIYLVQARVKPTA